MRFRALVAQLVCCCTLLVVFAPTDDRRPQALSWSTVRADPGRALLLVSGWAGWVLAAWMLLLTVLAVGAQSSSLAGRASARLVRMLAPKAVRRLLDATLGIALAVGPAGAAIAGPSAPGPSAPGPAISSLAPVPAPLVASPEPPPPDLDRPSIYSSGVDPDLAAHDRSAASSVHVIPLDRPVAAAKPAPTPAPLAQAPPSAPVPSPTHLVVAGDTLWDIAAATLPADATPADIAICWQRWYSANLATVGADPDLLRPGQLLTGPTR